MGVERVTLTLGALGTNCQLLRRGGRTLVVDPAADAPAILDALKQRGWSLDAVLLTHAHFDHMLALEELPVEAVYVHRADAPALRDPGLNLSSMWGAPLRCGKKAVLLNEGAQALGFTVLHTPGHTPGSICLYDAQEGLLAAGDTLFAGGWGRTDFPGGDAQAMAASLRRLMTLPDGTRVLPGHGPETTIARERAGGMPWNG